MPDAQLIRTLETLQREALRSGLPRLAEALEQTLLLAHLEIANRRESYIPPARRREAP